MNGHISAPALKTSRNLTNDDEEPLMDAMLPYSLNNIQQWRTSFSLTNTTNIVRKEWTTFFWKLKHKTETLMEAYNNFVWEEDSTLMMYTKTTPYSLKGPLIFH